MTRPRIAFVINSLAGGGAERVMTTLIAGSRDRADRHDIRLFLLDSEPRAYATPDWLDVVELDSRGSLARSTAGLVRALRAWRPAATLSFLTRANIAGVAAGRLLRHPAIVSERVNTSAHFGAGWKALPSRAMVRLAYPLARRIITVSQGVSDDLVDHFGVRRDRTIAIPNPVDGARIAALAAEPPGIVLPDRPFLVAAGRLTANKNHRLLIEAYAAARVEPALLILGEGEERAALQALVAELGLSDRVSMPGFVANPFAILSRAAAYVSASNAEGFPNGLVEAMAAGAPVISTNCPSGPAEVLAGMRRDQVHGLFRAEHGILVPPRDRAALTDAIRMMTDPETRRYYAGRAMAGAERYDVASAVAAYWKTIDQALGN